MSIEISPPHVDELKPRIAVIGVGGAGGNAIANMIAASVEGVDFIVANTDAQALNSSTAEQRIQLGPDVTQGLGAGSRPEVGRAAAEETVGDIEAMHRAIRERLLGIYGEEGGDVRILYGGSVKADNAVEILAVPEVGGALVGGASLTAESFYGIIRAASGENVD